MRALLNLICNACLLLGIILLPLLILALIVQVSMWAWDMGYHERYDYDLGTHVGNKVEAWITSLMIFGPLMAGYVWCAIWYWKALNSPGT